MSGELYGLAQALCALALLGALVWVVRRAGFGVFVPRKNRLIEIEDRVALDMRSALVVVRAEGRRWLLATSDQGPARVLAELAPEASERA
ncbi:MAG TPA: flagellar biosynthetic protein FliO [Polyangiales bacterium]|nr:flagellar biosynthetic protein FliO [Polyangiales bacterium]